MTVVSDMIHWLLATCGWVFLGIISSLMQACESQQQLQLSTVTSTEELSHLAVILNAIFQHPSKENLVCIRHLLQPTHPLVPSSHH